MASKTPGKGQPGPGQTTDKRKAGAESSKATEDNLVFPRQFTERLRQDSAENIARLKAARQEAIEGIDRDLEALARNDHGLDPEIVDQFVTLLKATRQELAGPDGLTKEQARYLRATGQRLAALVARVKEHLERPSDA